MRNFKKVLSLVLCMAMMLSVMVVGAGAAFSDQSKIQNTEAVDMCSALNIINGYTDGSFKPEGTITRAEACKMICVALNGGKEPTLGTSATASFTDTKGHWAEGYIESCVAQGIVAGVGGGKFAPNATVTGSQFAKMLLIALGYSAETENFVGAAWEINVNVKATAKGLYEDLESMDPSVALTRDNAAQMVWNALQAKEVKYDYTLVGTNGNLSSQITVADKNITLMADKYAAYDDASAQLTSFSYNSDKDEWTYYFDNESMRGHDSFTSSQDFTDLYMQNVKVVYTEKTNGSVDKVYGMYADDCVVLATAYVGDFDTVKSGDDEVTIAGVDYDLEQTAANTNVYTFTYGKDVTPVTQKLNTVANTQANVAFEVVAVDYDDNGDIDFFVMYTFVVDQVASMGTKNFTLENTAGSFKLEDVVSYDGMDEDDFVVYTPAANSATNDDTFAKVDTVLKGDITATKGDYKFAVDGTWYEATSDLGVAAGDSIKDAPVVNGYVFDASTSGTADVDDYAVVTAVDSNGYGYTAKLMFSDGTKKVVDTDADYEQLAGKLVYFEINSDDEYELTAATAMDIDETGFDAKAGTFNAQKDTNSSGKVKYIGGDNINDDAVIFMKDGDDYKVITGAQLKAVKGYNGTDALIEVEIAYVNENSDTGYDSVVMAYVTAEDETVSADQIYGFVTEDAISVRNKDDKTVYQLTIWTEDGEVVLNTKYGVSVAGVEEGALIAYGVNGDNEIDELDVLTVVGVADNTATQAITAYDGTYIQLDNGTDRYEITSDSTIIYINVADSEGVATGSIQKAAKTGTGDYYNNVYFIADDDEVDILFVDVNRDIDDVM